MRPVLIVEDHPLVAEATGKLLALFGDDIRAVVCSDAPRAITNLDDRSEPWFRIFLDLDVPGAYGLSLAREVQRRGLAGRCCVASAFDKQEYVDEIRGSGFLGYIVKAVPVEEFTGAIAKVLRGERSFPVMPSARRAPAIRLTRRQTQLVELLRSGLSSKEIAAELNLAEGTVNNHIASILQAFDAGTRAHAVARAIELGLLEPHHPYGDRGNLRATSHSKRR
jgi:two-component system, NarL family, response regulator DesR